MATRSGKKNIEGFLAIMRATLIPVISGTKKLASDIGAGFRLDQTNDSELSRTKNCITVTEAMGLGDIKELNTGVWLNETLRMNDRFRITAGIRWDRFDVSYKGKLD